MGQKHNHWWERRTTVAALVLLSMIPLLWPVVPPLVDLPGHMGRYRVQLDYDTSAVLRQFYDFKWSLIGNLGIDLLIVPISKIFGLELGVKLIVMAIPALTVGGLLWIAREVHGEVPPTALFALPLAYGHPFQFGFVNFALAMALALLAFALWLRLARLGRLRLRAVVFLIIAPLIWVCHAFGWGTLGVLAFSAELVRQHDHRNSWFRSVVNTMIQCLVLVPPLLLMILWRSGAVSGQTGDWFDWSFKLQWLTATLRDRWRLFDLVSICALFLLVGFAITHRRIGFSRNLAASALFLIIVFILLPRIVFGSAYADMRMTPFMIAIAVVAIRVRPEASAKLVSGLAIAGLAFFAVRTAATTVSFAMAATQANRALGALDHVPFGARLVSFAGKTCRRSWPMERLTHLSAMATVRRYAFSNDQWDMAGAQLLGIRKLDARHYRGDPSQVVTERRCPTDKWKSLNMSLAYLPRNAFDYVWLIEPPRFDPRWLRGMILIWADGHNALYRINDRTMPQVTP